MTEQEKADLTSKINETIEKTKLLIEELKELTKPISPENAIGRITRMDAINNKSINEATLRQEETKMKKLDYALTKIDETDFGICIRCKGAIPPARLMLVPESVRCVHCAQ